MLELSLEGIGTELAETLPFAVNRFFKGGLERVEASVLDCAPLSEFSIHRRFLSLGEADMSTQQTKVKLEN